MKKKWTVLFMIVSFVSYFGCGGGEKTKSPAKEINKKPSVAKGNPERIINFENKLVKLALRVGWEVYDGDLDQGLMRIHQKEDISGIGPIIHFTFHGNIIGSSSCGTQPKEQVEKMSEKYQGSQVKAITYNNIQYYQTTYHLDGPQVMLQTKINGSCIQIKLTGKGVQSNKDILNILNTVSYKIPLKELEAGDEKSKKKQDVG